MHGFFPSACFFHHQILGSHPNLVGGLNPSEKSESVGTIVPNIYGKIKNVPNHQPEIGKPPTDSFAHVL